MTACVHSRVRSFPNNSALGPYLRVKLDAGFLVVAGATEDELGILEQRVLATNNTAPVRLLSPGETVRMVAAEAIPANADVYRAAGGKIADTNPGTAERIGIALEAASGDGSIIEVLPKQLADVT